VVEDSVTGVEAAKSAGIFTLGFLGAAHVYDGHGAKLMEAGADLVFPDAAALALFFRDKGLL
jgi:beta-phosphoglucomutase-like phosphatase (HAD superfamily)